MVKSRGTNIHTITQSELSHATKQSAERILELGYQSLQQRIQNLCHLAVQIQSYVPFNTVIIKFRKLQKER